MERKFNFQNLIKFGGIVLAAFGCKKVYDVHQEKKEKAEFEAICRKYENASWFDLLRKGGF